MIISHLVNAIQDSATFAIAGKASKLKSEGFDVISLALGEPDFETPSNVKDAAIKAIYAGDTKYTAVDGTKALKQAIMMKFQKENGLDYTMSEISVACGVKQILFNVLMSLVNEGDEVILPAPYWASYTEMVLFARGKPVAVQCLLDSGFKLTPRLLESAITRKTKLLILNSPSNPTGAAYTRKELQDLAATLKKYPDIYVISDDIYEHIVFDHFEFATLAAVAPEMRDRIITANGVSKSYSMTGWRIGYAGAPEVLVKAMSKVQGQATASPCSISQAAAIEALQGDQSFIKERAAIFEKRRDLLLEKLREIKYMSCSKPQGAFYLLPSCQGYFGKITPSGKIIKDSLDFASYLLEDALVAVVPGEPFAAEGFYRISYATSEANLIEACARIKDSCSKLL